MTETNHELEAGDGLTDETGVSGSVEAVHGDGSVTVKWEDGAETHDHDEIVGGLVHGTIERADGKSHELVKSF